MTYLHQHTQASNKSIMKTQILEPYKGLKRELITYPPHKANFIISGRYIFTCECCGDRYGAMACHAKYCSDACRVRASRIRNGRCANRREAARKAADTKAWLSDKIVCECCGEEFGRPRSQGLRMYCSNACKQKAYRQRRYQSATSDTVTGFRSDLGTSKPVTRFGEVKP